MIRRSLRSLLRRYPRQPWRTILVILALAAVILLRCWDRPDRLHETDSLEPGIHQVERVVDGDTLVLANQARVRLIGADTPETVKPGHPVEPWGPEATEFTRQFVAAGQVRLELDGPTKDRYGRFLAHVWVGDRMLGQELIRRGLATATTHYRYSEDVKARLREAEAEARAAGRGIWSQ